ncbi:hypothetical protein ACJRO7_000838 [Eucalyptus globulus]|uniref:Uncharacterized protein n=1 Tax=Eucalyptus globulus TaxID=34317 RepID=A0ABD3LNX8_EUCGL
MATPPLQPPPPPPAPVVGPQYCAPFPIDLGMVRKLISITEGNFAVSDSSGNEIFKVKHVFNLIHTKRALVDAAGNTILTFKQKKITAHSRWQVFRGESTEPDDLVFTARTSSMFQLKTKLHVFLAGNKSERTCDYRVEGSWAARSCSIYVGESNYMIAQMHTKHTIQSVAIGRDTYAVTVYPNIDHAFIVALVAILNEIDHDKKDKE